MSKGPQKIRGTQDIFGEDAARFRHVIEVFERVRKLYAFQPVEVPAMEATELFARSIGETSDIVSKEMYTFEDKGGDSVTLRPEFTAGICRAYLSEGWQQYGVLKLATHGPVFRYERPQKGRYRQFHQLDAEIIGSDSPMADVELLALADQLLRELGIAEGVMLELNTLGDAATREAWRAALVRHFEANRDVLSEESVARLERNPFRILDSKDARDRPVAEAAPGIDDFLTSEAADFFAQVTAGLDAAGIAWTRNPCLVRGLDYYRHTAFEFVTDRLGAQGAVIAGGRYDGLIESLGGPATPAVGWAAGIERLAMLVVEWPRERLDVVVVADDNTEDILSRTMTLGRALRNRGFSADVIATGKLGRRYEKAQRKFPRLILIVEGEAEIRFVSTAKRPEGDLKVSGRGPDDALLRMIADENHPHPFRGLLADAE